MIGTIAKKEFLENVLSRKFLVASVLAVLILGVGVYTMGSQYEEDQSWYQTRMEEYRQGEPSTYLDIAEMEIFRTLGNPEPLTSLTGNQSDYDVYGESRGMDPVQSALGQETESPLWARFGLLDLAFIVGFLMSLMAVIFSYDTISGEKEGGTLKLTLTNDVPKDNILLGKYIGGTASVILPFLAAIVLALGVTAIGFGIPFSGGDYQAILVLVVLGCAVISAFYLLGMFVSSLTERSATSMIVALLVWIILTQGIGGVAALTASQTTETMTYGEYQDQSRAIMNEVRQNYDNMTAMREEMEEKLGALEDAYRRSQEAQLNTALIWARISPTEAYQNIAQAVSGQSWDERVVTVRQATDYSTALQEEYEEETGSAGTGFGPGKEEDQQGEEIEAFEPDTELEQFYVPWDLGKRLDGVTYDIAAIILINIFLFVGAYVAFLRYDVR